jgi:DNA-binding transcriptional LysR family regulator
MTVLSRCLAELARALPGAELKVRRGASTGVLEALQSGEADIAVAGPLEAWDRLDVWPLFREQVELAVNADHRLGRLNGSQVELDELFGEAILRRFECEAVEELKAHCSNLDSIARTQHEVETDHDLVALLEANAGIAFLSSTAPQSSTVRRLKLAHLELWRSISVYVVAGRMRSAAAGMLLNLLRAADWSRLGVNEPV